MESSMKGYVRRYLGLALNASGGFLATVAVVFAALDENRSWTASLAPETASAALAAVFWGNVILRVWVTRTRRAP